jgi:hypothetical protein
MLAITDPAEEFLYNSRAIDDSRRLCPAIFSVVGIMNPLTMCKDNLDVGSKDVLVSEPSHCVDPVFEIGWSTSNSFIHIMLTICLLAFGGPIVGMITRLS